mmetsp:Transcript_3601/g.5463  ORF Transcript_3601/g.5463 Transcript_3601/m.5463 type:complete len:756 (+) Transcript_3601:141-2408(+)
MTRRTYIVVLFLCVSLVSCDNLGMGLREVMDDYLNQSPSLIARNGLHSNDLSIETVQVDLFLNGFVHFDSIRQSLLSVTGAKILSEAPEYMHGVFCVDLPKASIVATSRLKGVYSLALTQPLTTSATYPTELAFGALRVQQAMSKFSGRGVTVAVISDSFNNQKRAAGDVRDGNLPGPENPYGHTKPITVLQDFPGVDEGRAMLQIIHSIAPEARLCFGTGVVAGLIGMGNMIRRLAAAPCNADIIVDDIGGYDNPYVVGVTQYQVNQVTAQGVLYVSAATNRRYYNRECAVTLVPSTSPSVPDYLSARTEIDSWARFPSDIRPLGSSGNFLLPVKADQDSLAINVWWNQAFTKVYDDLDVYVLDENFTNVSKSSDNNFRTGIAGERVRLPKGFVGYIAIGRKATRTAPMELPALRLWLVPIFGYSFPFPPTEKEYSSVYGHSAARKAITVGAYDYWNLLSPANYSSPGPAHVFWDEHGTLLHIDGETRQKPVVGGVSCVDNSFFWTQFPDYENNGFPNFCGTSAAAPHVAAVLALLKHARPSLTFDEFVRAMKTSSRDGAWGINGGYGLIDADAALDYIRALKPQSPSQTQRRPTRTPSRTSKPSRTPSRTPRPSRTPSRTPNLGRTPTRQRATSAGRRSSTPTPTRTGAGPSGEAFNVTASQRDFSWSTNPNPLRLSCGADHPNHKLWEFVEYSYGVESCRADPTLLLAGLRRTVPLRRHDLYIFVTSANIGLPSDPCPRLPKTLSVTARCIP